MVLTKAELNASLKYEVNILLHLASKIDRAQLDYRPAETAQYFGAAAIPERGGAVSRQR